MTTLAETRDGLEAVLGSITDLRVFDYIPANPLPPVAIIFPPTVPDYWGDVGGGRGIAVRFPVLLLTASNIDRQQLQLYELIEKTGPRSVFAAVQADRSLGGLNVKARAASVEDFDTERFGLNDYFGRVVNIDVFVTGD